MIRTSARVALLARVRAGRAGGRRAAAAAGARRHRDRREPHAERSHRQRPRALPDDGRAKRRALHPRLRHHAPEPAELLRALRRRDELQRQQLPRPRYPAPTRRTSRANCSRRTSRSRRIPESLPSVGFLGCSAGQYAKKHASWTFFSNIPQQLHLPLTRPEVVGCVADGDDHRARTSTTTCTTARSKKATTGRSCTWRRC